MYKGERLPVTDVVKQEEKKIRWKDPDSRGKDLYPTSISERVKSATGAAVTLGRLAPNLLTDVRVQRVQLWGCTLPARECREIIPTVLPPTSLMHPTSSESQSAPQIEAGSSSGIQRRNLVVCIDGTSNRFCSSVRLI